MMDNVWINYIVDVEIGCVESLFRRWSISCSCYMYNGQWLVNNSGSPYIVWACWYLLLELYDRIIQLLEIHSIWYRYQWSIACH